MIKSILGTIAALTLCAISCASQASEKGNYWFLKGQFIKGGQVVSTFSAPLVSNAPFSLDTHGEVSLLEAIEPTKPASGSAEDQMFALRDTVNREAIGGFNNAKKEAHFMTRVALLETGSATATVGITANVSEISRLPVDLDQIKPGVELTLPKYYSLKLDTGLFLWKDKSVELPLGSCVQSKLGDNGCFRLVVTLESGSSPTEGPKAAKGK